MQEGIEQLLKGRTSFVIAHRLSTIQKADRIFVIDDGRIIDFDEKPMVSTSSTISCGIYVIRRRQLIELIERCAAEDRVSGISFSRQRRFLCLLSILPLLAPVILFRIRSLQAFPAPPSHWTVFQ